MEWADQLLSKMLGVADWMAVLKNNIQHKKRYFYSQADSLIEEAERAWQMRR